MLKSFIILTLAFLGLGSAAHADDLFSRISLDSPFSSSGTKPSGTTATGEKAPPSDRASKVLNADHLAEMLRDADLEPKVEGDDFVSLKFKHQRWDFPVAINMTDKNARLWIVFVLTKLEGGKQLKAEQLAGLLGANRDLRPAMFTMADSGKRIELYLALPNEQISPKALRDSLQTLAGVAEQTAGLWEVTAASAGNNSSKSNDSPNGRPAPNGQNGQNGANGQVAKQDAPAAKPVPNSPPPVTSAPSAASGLLGKWSAAVGEKDAMALLLKADGSFVLAQVKDGKQGRVAGTFTFANGLLTLTGTDGTKIITGSVAQTSDKAFDFTPQNGTTKGAKLSFKKAS